MENCFHCGDLCEQEVIVHQQKKFCCFGCKTVYEILQENGLSHYYDINENPGTSPFANEGKYDFLADVQIAKKLLLFDEQNTHVVSLSIPSIHCSSCIWVLENLHKLCRGVKTSQVNFPKKKVQITYSSEETSLHALVLLLTSIGYEPQISLDDATPKETTTDRSLIYKLGVAGFAFGNVMLLSFPEYFEVNEFWLERFKHLFRWMMFAFSLPVVFYAASDYYKSAIKGLRSGILNIDVPIALGISVLFVRSSLEIIMDWGTGFFDSLTGLVFFLLVGKFFQQKTYAFLSFERDYKSYFPLAVTKLTEQPNSTKVHEEQTQVFDLKANDLIFIRHGELIPTDAILEEGQALIDYSFVTGEAAPITKNEGETLYAGGRQQGGTIKLRVLKPVEQSYLTRLWSSEVFQKDKQSSFHTLTNKISRHFTITLISIALMAMIFWLLYDASLALNVFTAVLIVACPCAIALAAPFTLGNLLRIFGNHKCYLKNSLVIEQLAQIDTVVFDKTGTLTSTKNNVAIYDGISLTNEEQSLLTSTLRASGHPLSRALYQLLKDKDIYSLDYFEEETGKGIYGKVKNYSIRVGTYDYVLTSSLEPQAQQSIDATKTVVHISSNDVYKGCYVFQNNYREGIEELFGNLKNEYQLMVLSGDNDGERNTLEAMLPPKTALVFNQKPEDKLAFIKDLQEQGKNVMMVGDGLNDSGALAQSNVGIAVSENVNVFSPACDGILDASRFEDLSKFLALSKKGIRIIKYAFVFSLLYNLIGLGFAITGNLEPVVAAILMPLSSISIVVFTTLYSYRIGQRLNPQTPSSYETI